MKWKAQTEQSLKVISGSWKGMQVYEQYIIITDSKSDTLEDLKKKI